MKSLNGKNILVTGGAGFIGSHLCDRLIKEKPKKIIVQDNFFLGKNRNLEVISKFPGFKLYKTSTADYKALKEILEKEKIDVVFNLAIVPLPCSLEKPEWSFNENVDMTLNICKLARLKMFKTLVHYSSSEAYGTSKKHLMDEKHPLIPLTPYAASKAAADLLVESYGTTFNLDYVIICPFNNYGPRQNEGSYAGIIPLTMKRILNNENPIIFGTGQQTRDFIYVEDTVDNTVKIYQNENTRSKKINLASGVEVDILTVVKTILKETNSNLEINFEPPRKSDVMRHCGDVTLVKSLIDFTTKVSFEEGTAKTIKWFKKNLIK